MPPRNPWRRMPIRRQLLLAALVIMGFVILLAVIDTIKYYLSGH